MSASGGFNVTPNDSTTFAPTKGLWIGGTGAVAVVMMDGDTVTFAAVPANKTLDIRVTKVKSTGTTATNIVALV